MIAGARFVHTNLVAHDWRSLARFYQEVFGCVPVPPERNLSGAEMEAGTRVPKARLQGMHLRLPGATAEGPTLEIFTYSDLADDLPRVANRPGFAHIAFAVDSVAEAREEVLSHGGAPVGDVVTVNVSATARVTWCYVKDPEGNIIELQAWSSGEAGAGTAANGFPVLAVDRRALRARRKIGRSRRHARHVG